MSDVSAAAYTNGHGPFCGLCGAEEQTAGVVLHCLSQQFSIGVREGIDVSDDNTKNNTSNGARGAKMIFL